jgi:hypothetical protein
MVGDSKQVRRNLPQVFPDPVIPIFISTSPGAYFGFSEKIEYLYFIWGRAPNEIQILNFFAPKLKCTPCPELSSFLG